MSYHYDSRDIESYITRMRSCRPFIMMGIEPEWAPGTGDIEGFCHDEVVRQYHDTRVRDDGGVRVGWMRAAWEYAQRAAADHDLPTIVDILALGALIEPKVNSTIGFRTMNVYIGNSTGAPPRHINRMVVALLQQVDCAPLPWREGPHAEQYRAFWSRRQADQDEVVKGFERLVQDVVTADDWYMAYEAIHPFGDGNGRSGKVLSNWLYGSLDEPILIEDYFGGGNP